MDEVAVRLAPGLVPPVPQDLREAALTLGEAEVRYLVDTYYEMQDYRKANANQERALAEAGEPNQGVAFFAAQFKEIEREIKVSLDQYSLSVPLGEWARGTVGVGPVIAAGLLTHIDITKAKTAGAIWRFAGLDPTIKWEKGQKRPYNARLKVLCWKLGDSFVKFSGHERSLYGRLYRERKSYELRRDEEGGNAETAAQTLAERNFRDKETRKIYESGHLPAGRIDQRARRWAVKLYLAHYHEAAYRLHYGERPPKPFAIEQMGHAHYIEPEVEFPAV